MRDPGNELNAGITNKVNKTEELIIFIDRIYLLESCRLFGANSPMLSFSSPNEVCRGTLLSAGSRSR